jgi:peptidoglycan hydrolase-like protein with peptidoglycan-binding domain
MKMSRFAVRTFLSAAVVVVVATAGLAVAASPAAASTPQCTMSGSQGSAWGDEIIPVSSGGSNQCWLAKGDISSAVTALQKVLNCNSQPVLTVDGNFGSHTRTSVINFQTWANGQDRSVSIDGVYGPQTESWLQLLPLVSNGICEPIGG